MDVTPLIPVGQQIIQSYKGGQFKISGIYYPHPVIVTPARTENWAGPSTGVFTEQDFSILLETIKSLDVVLLGTGKTMQLLPATIKNALSAQGLFLDIMDTGAACRTYNVLMAEGRRVAAALIPYVD